MLRSLSLIPLGLWSLILFSLSLTVFSINHGALHHRGVRTAGGIHLPLHRREARASGRHKRSEETGVIGLGDYIDVTYSVVVTIGDTETSLVLDTGSSDLWVISNTCTNCNSTGTNIPLYPQATFQATGLEAQILYGDSQTGTHAYGPIGTDIVGIAGLTMQNQYFAAVNDTNTSVLSTGSAGIFGLGFPVNSVIWSEVFVSQHPTSSPSKREAVPSDPAASSTLLNLATRFFPNFNFNRPIFPSLPLLSRPTHSITPRQSSSSGSSSTSAILSSFASTGPLLSRLVSTAALAAPMFTVTLQRDTVELGGNAGVLSLGELPSDVSNSTLTWVPVRGYTVNEGGLAAPSDSPNEVYPIAWEIPIDDVYFDGQKLPRSALSASNITLSALLDTGNSLIRGPSDVIQTITNTLGTNGQFACSSNHTLAFQIGGNLFPVDPRDFASQAYNNSIAECVANLASTDPPQEGHGYLYSWSLGDPFLKSVLASFYYGNLTYPSQDPPRIGLLSTVPADAGDEMSAAVASASAAGGNFPAASEAAPSGSYTAHSSINTSGVIHSSGASIAHSAAGALHGWAMVGVLFFLSGIACS